MINYKIIELSELKFSLYKVQKFLLNLIKKEYGLNYIPKFHKDIELLKNFYIAPVRNTFFLAINTKTNEIIGSIGIREYDRKSECFENNFSRKSTASFYRVFVDEKYRRNGIASALVKKAEKFCYNQGYNEIYLHTQNIVDGALFFWNKMNFNIIFKVNDKLDTVHMSKNIYRVPLKLYDISLTSIQAK